MSSLFFLPSFPCFVALSLLPFFRFRLPGTRSYPTCCRLPFPLQVPPSFYEAVPNLRLLSIRSQKNLRWSVRSECCGGGVWDDGWGFCGVCGFCGAASCLACYLPPISRLVVGTGADVTPFDLGDAWMHQRRADREPVARHRLPVWRAISGRRGDRRLSHQPG